jgi:hypothetical protein
MCATLKISPDKEGILKRLTIIFIGLLLMCFVSDKAYNVEYTEIVPDLCPEKDRTYPRLEGRACLSGDFKYVSIKELTDFGGRPRFSPDGKKIAFAEGEYKEAYEIDLETEELTCLTCDFEHEGFLRVYYLKDGDYLFIGTKRLFQNSMNRLFSNAIFWMPADRSVAPRYLGEEHYEGIAVSKESRKIAYFTHMFNTGKSKLFIAEIDLNGNIINKTENNDVFKHFSNYAICEAQDFFPNDSGLAFIHYGSFIGNWGPPTQTYSLDFETGQLINQTKSSAHEEPEGLFPDGQYAALESNRHFFQTGQSKSDVYLLKLDGTGKQAYRLSYFTDTQGATKEWGNNPNVSPEGCRVAYSRGFGRFGINHSTGKLGGVFIAEFHECSCTTE